MATELPFVFQIPGITELKEIYYQDGGKLTIDDNQLHTLTEENIQKMTPDFWRDKCYIDSEGNLNPVPFSKIRGFEKHGNYILFIVDWTMSPLAGKILPAYFDDPDNTAHLAKIFINDKVRDEHLVQWPINIAEFFSMTKTEQHQYLEKLATATSSCYLKEIDLPNGGGSYIVRLPMPFVRIRGLRPKPSEDGGYVFVDVDWQDKVNTDYRGLEGQRAAMALPYEHDLDFHHLTEEQQARNVEALIEAGWIQNENGDWYDPNASGGGHSGGRKSNKSKNKKSYKSKKSYKNKKSYKKSNKTKSKKKNKRRGF